MLTEVLKVSSQSPEKEVIEKGAKAIQQGKLVVFPTETVYGIAVNALDEAALEKLYQVKGRPKDKPLSWHVANLSQVYSQLENKPDWLDDFLTTFWPGPLTVVLKVGNGQTCGFRMPDHPVALALIQESHVPVVAPSANLSGAVPPVTMEQALADLNGKVDLALDAGKTEVQQESTVLDLSSGEPQILRQGALSKEQIDSWFERNR